MRLLLSLSFPVISSTIKILFCFRDQYRERESVSRNTCCVTSYEDLGAVVLIIRIYIVTVRLACFSQIGSKRCQRLTWPKWVPAPCAQEGIAASWKKMLRAVCNSTTIINTRLRDGIYLYKLYCIQKNVIVSNLRIDRDSFLRDEESVSEI